MEVSLRNTEPAGMSRHGAVHDPETKPTEDWNKAFLVKSFSHGTNLLESWVITKQPPVQA